MLSFGILLDSSMKPPKTAIWRLRLNSLQEVVMALVYLKDLFGRKELTRKYLPCMSQVSWKNLITNGFFKEMMETMITVLREQRDKNQQPLGYQTWEEFSCWLALELFSALAWLWSKSFTRRVKWNNRDNWTSLEEQPSDGRDLLR